MKDMSVTVYFKDGREPEVIKDVNNFHKKAFHFVMFANNRVHLYELDKIERIEVTL